MLTRLRIDNHKTFVNFEIAFDRVNLLVGANGTGKTNLLEVVTGLRRVLSGGENVHNVFPPSSRTRWQTLGHQLFELVVSIPEGEFTYRLQLGRPKAAKEGETVIETESVLRGGQQVLFRYEHGEVQLHNEGGKKGPRFPVAGRSSFISQIEDRPESRSLVAFREWIRENLWIGRIDPRAVDSRSDEEAAQLDASASNYAAWYRHLSQERPEGFDELENQLRPMFPGLSRLRAVAESGSTRALKLEFGTKSSPPGPGGSHAISFSELSDGQRALVILYTILLTFGTGRTNLIDEPDNFLAPHEVQPWLVQACDAARKRGQLIVCSHHPETVNYMAPDGVLFLERMSGGPTTVRTLEPNLETGETAYEALKAVLS